jgi:hypothetical protein
MHTKEKNCCFAERRQTEGNEENKGFCPPAKICNLRFLCFLLFRPLAYDLGFRSTIWISDLSCAFHPEVSRWLTVGQSLRRFDITPSPLGSSNREKKVKLISDLPHQQQPKIRSK